MATLRLFNPENDLALAAGTPYFTPPKAAVTLHRAGAVLPAWWSAEDDIIIASEADIEWLRGAADAFTLPARRFTGSESYDKVAPWGWSPYTRLSLEKAGVDSHILPSDSRLADIRRLSHRALTADIFRYLSQAHLPYPLPHAPVEASDTAAIARRLSAAERVFIKAPWSSSGRGVIDSGTYAPGQFIRMAEGIIRRQGSVMVERALDKVMDFAMLFDMEDGRARFVGPSLFFNAGATAYEGNLLASPSQLLAQLYDTVPEAWIPATVGGVTKALEATIGTRYDGPLGVDMMVYRHPDGSLGINPCIEVNLRMTMGRVAHEIHSRHLPAYARGVMKIIRGPYTEASDLIMRLTPPAADFNFIVTAL